MFTAKYKSTKNISYHFGLGTLIQHKAKLQTVGKTKIKSWPSFRSYLSRNADNSITNTNTLKGVRYTLYPELGRNVKHAFWLDDALIFHVRSDIWHFTGLSRPRVLDNEVNHCYVIKINGIVAFGDKEPSRASRHLLRSNWKIKFSSALYSDQKK